MKRRTLRLSAPRQPASAGCRFVALRRIARIFTMGPFARAGVFLARSGFRLREFRSGVNGPRLTLRSLTYRLIILVRPFDSATCAGLPQRQEASTPQNPVALLPVRSSGRASNLHSPSGVFGSLWIKAFDWLPDLPVHLPDLPDLRSLPAAVLSLVGLRIIVPDPLHFRRLAVPQTSWNLHHYATPTFRGSTNFSSNQTLFNRFFHSYFERVTRAIRESAVNKTCAPKFVESIFTKTIQWHD